MAYKYGYRPHTIILNVWKRPNMTVDYKQLATKGLCSEKEYRYIGNLIESISPGNVLIFSLGYDSNIWNILNKDGNTVFIEHEEVYINSNHHLRVIPITYTTTVKDWKVVLKNRERLYIDLGDDLKNTIWDVIFIDGPQGHSLNSPGRMQSIYTASTLSYRHILAHDCHRKVENVYFQKYIGKPTHTIDTLFHYINI